MRDLRVGIFLGQFDHSISDHYVVTRLREAITSDAASYPTRRTGTSAYKRHPFSEFLMPDGRELGCLHEYGMTMTTLHIFVVCRQSGLVYIQSLLLRLHAEKLMLPFSPFDAYLRIEPVMSHPYFASSLPCGRNTSALCRCPY
jgi:hypothetical protein